MSYCKIGKIYIDSLENYYRVKAMIDSGETDGHLRKFFGISRQLYKNIKEDRIQIEGDYIRLPFCEKLSKYQVNVSTLKLHGLTLEEYKRKYPNAKTITLSLLIKKSNNNKGNIVSELSRQKIRNANLGKKHSLETIKKLSEMYSGDRNPSKKCREKLLVNHISKKNPEKWEEIKKIIGEKSKKNYTEELARKIHEGKLNSSKYGSKPQIMMFNILRKYFSLFYKVNVEMNSNKPYMGRRLYCDISIEQLRIGIEWDGILHRKPIYGEKCFQRLKHLDTVKDILSKESGWDLIRVKDECPNRNYKTYLPIKFREIISEIRSRGRI